MIARYVVGLIELTPSQLAAASVSGNSPLTSLDAALIARWIVGFNDAINQTGKWKFTPVSRMYGGVNDDLGSQDYTAILMGDVNGDWVAPTMLARPVPVLGGFTKDAVVIEVANKTAAPASEVVIPVTISNLGGKEVSSYQFDIEYDPKVITPAQLAAEVEGTLGGSLSVVANAPAPGLLKVVVFGALPASGDGIYLNLRFVVTGAAGSSSPLQIREFRLNDGVDETVTMRGTVFVNNVRTVR